MKDSTPTPRKKNQLEIALEANDNNDSLDFYLEVTSTVQIRKDINEIKAKSADKEVIKTAIAALNELL